MAASFDKRELLELAGPRSGPCASLYMPAHKRFTETREDRNRLKNLLRAVQSEVEALGSRSAAAEEMLAPARKLLADDAFWGRGGEGLAVFLAPGFARTEWLPVPVEELASAAADCFHVKPLMQLLNGDGRFFVLALSQNRVRLLRGSRFGITELQPEGLPKSLADALWADDWEQSLQYHSVAPRGQQAQQSAIFHGQGGPEDKRKDELLRYFRSIDRPLTAHLREDNAPLVIAGVDYYLPIYREANTYPKLVDTVIRGNQDTQPADDLHREAWKIVGPRFAQDEAAAEERFRAAAGTGMTTTELAKVLDAARVGQIETLFVALDRHRWSPTDDPTATLHEVRQPGDLDLLDRAAVSALQTGATVYSLPATHMPSPSETAAILRY